VIVGVPGAGISAIFYLACVVLMPFHTLWCIMTGRELRPDHWRLVARQATIAAGIVVSVAAVGWALGFAAAAPQAAVGSPSAATGEPLDRLLSRVGVYLIVGTLVSVIVAVQVLSILARRRQR
jgi:hypothetical protein